MSVVAKYFVACGSAIAIGVLASQAQTRYSRIAGVYAFSIQGQTAGATGQLRLGWRLLPTDCFSASVRLGRWVIHRVFLRTTLQREL
jgi:hypothetical protein